jgi:hypothetical protein
MPFDMSIRLKVVHDDKFVFAESVKFGSIEAKEAFLKFIIDAEIIIDDAEIKQISILPEVSKELGQVKAPETPQYKPTDWRAKRPYMREVQWQKRPIIDYVINTYKDDLLKSVREKFKSISPEWQQTLFSKVKYYRDPKALQLSPSPDKKLKSIYVAFELNLKAFIGKFANEFIDAFDSGKITNINDEYVFQTSLTGVESLFKILDPYAGSKLSSTMVHGREIADEPGYDINIKSGIYDRIVDIIEPNYDGTMTIKQFSDDGKLHYTIDRKQEPDTIPDAIADKIPEESS